jgi:hypothetical protein
MSCAKESPKGHRKLNFPQALEAAVQMGTTILTEAKYRFLATLGQFDWNSLSWIDLIDDKDPESTHIAYCNSGGVLIRSEKRLNNNLIRRRIRSFRASLLV